MARKKKVKPIDYSELSGGLSRMLDRFNDEGTLTGDPDADDFIRNSPEAALLGMLYDQRVRAEYAFTGPARLQERLGHLDMNKISRMRLDTLIRKFEQKPAVHRFTNKMAEYTHDVARIVAKEYGGDPSKLWDDGADYATIQKRLEKLPGFGKMKAIKMRYVLHYFGYRDFGKEN